MHLFTARSTTLILLTVATAVICLFSSTRKVSAVNENLLLSCSGGWIIQGSCTNANGRSNSLPPPDYPPYTYGDASCSKLAEDYRLQFPNLNITATCENHCTTTMTKPPGDTCVDPVRYWGLCARPFPSAFYTPSNNMSCGDTDIGSTGAEVFCCRYNISTPTPPPPCGLVAAQQQ